MTKRTLNPGQAFSRSEEYAAIVAWFAAGNTGAVTDVPTTMTSATANRYIRHAHKAGLLRIADWQRRALSGPPTAIFGHQPGGLADAPRPPRTPDNVKALKWARTEKGKASRARSRARRRQDPEKHLEDILYHRARHSKNNPRTVEQIDPLLAALTRRK